MAKMSDQEKKDWIELCDYFKYKILNYTEDMKFPQKLALRLKGLHYGNYIANKHIPKQAHYDYKVILITCKICRNKIVNYIQNNAKKINGEEHKINLAMSFIEKEINDVYIRLKQCKHSQEKLKNIDLSNQANDGAKYQIKSKKADNKLNNLW